MTPSVHTTSFSDRKVHDCQTTAVVARHHRLLNENQEVVFPICFGITYNIGLQKL